MSRSRPQRLLQKSIASAISAIEIYNKPDFKYREETFSLLMTNAWELLLKARILQNNNNDLTALYIKEEVEGRGGPWRYKRNRSGNKMTIGLTAALNNLKKEGDLEERVIANLEILIEIRDNAVHYYNADPKLSQKILEAGTANLQNYVMLVQVWFDHNLERYNFYLMPISFFHQTDVSSFSVRSRNNQIDNLLDYIDKTETNVTDSDPTGPAVTLRLKTELIKSGDSGAIPIYYDDSPDASPVKVEEENIFRRKYPLSYADLVEKMKEKYSNFKQNRRFYNIKRKLENKGDKYCKERYLDFENKSGSKKRYYSTEIFKEFDKHYTRG